TNGDLLATDPTGAQPRWSFIGDGTIDTTPVTASGIVFTGSSSGHLYGLDPATGAQLWSATATGAVATSDGFDLHTGLAAGGGLLAVPAGGYLTVYTN
ncbi:MAG: hypothetical protein JWO63_2962, partial [Frankiales bacterium]|nr:hypothetical protein [Frankiales bacterium]